MKIFPNWLSFWVEGTVIVAELAVIIFAGWWPFGFRSSSDIEEYDEKTDSTSHGNDWLPIKDNVVIKQALEQE